MGKHHELSEEKHLFLLKLWCRERGMELERYAMFPPEEKEKYLKEWGMSEVPQ